MPWTYSRFRCRRCKRPTEDAGYISARGLCALCGDTAFSDNLHQLAAHSGPYFQHWRRRCVAAFGGVLLDDLEDDGHA